jgi:hypothetical protein
MITTPRIPPEILEGLRHGNEHSLADLFRQYYDPLVEEAEESLGDYADAAPRIVERAFLRVWQERQMFETPAMLEMVIRSVVREAVLREQTRRASLRRMEAHQHVKLPTRPSAPRPGVAEAWADVERLLHPPKTDDPHSRVHVKFPSARRGRRVVPILGGIVAVALTVLGMLKLSEPNRDVSIARALAAPDARNILSAAGQIGSTTLSEGTTVKIAPMSRLRVAGGFSAELRGVELAGAASFAVPDIAGLALELRLPGTTVLANGARFDVRADSARPVAIRVREGSVAVRGASGERTLGAGEAAALV